MTIPVNRRATRSPAAFTVSALLAALALSAAPSPARAASLVQVTSFGNNPTNLQMYLYVPANVAARPGILVASHPCGGSGPSFYSSSEFASLADRYGFIVIYPSANTGTGGAHCFDIESAGALQHAGNSDPAGVRSMIAYVVQNYGADTSRIFATGSSSGAMFTNVLLANYPDVFAAGAPFMSVPVGCMAGFDPTVMGNACSQGQVTKTAQAWGDIVRAAYPGYTGPRPRVQLWHGTADSVLNYANLAEEVKQWTNVLGLSATPTLTDSPVSGWTRAYYGGTGTMPPLETITVQGANHVLPQSGMAAYAIAFFGLDQTSTGTTYPLTVTRSGTGSGTVTSSAGGISCGSTCTATLASGTAVTLTATPASGSTFAGWSGACTGTGTCIVTMTAAQAVGAAFTGTTPPSGTVSINVGGPAVGTFAADTGFSGGTTYTNSNTVDTSQITSGAPPAQVFQSERYGNFTYTVGGLTAGSAQTVTLYFAETYFSAAGQRSFGVSINGASALSAFDIYASAGGQNKAIARSFSATASAGGQVVIQFTNGSANNAKVNGLTVAAGGTTPPPTTYTLTVSKAGTGSGTVSGGGIACGAACSASVTAGTIVTLTAAPDASSTFGGWSGACSGTATTCAVTLNAAQSVTATFTGSSSSAPCASPVTFTGQSGNFNTTGAVCLRTSAAVNGWGCSNFAGRTVSVNGGAAASACGAGPFPLARSSDGYTYFSVSAGTYPWASLYTW